MYISMDLPDKNKHDFVLTEIPHFQGLLSKSCHHWQLHWLYHFYGRKDTVKFKAQININLFKATPIYLNFLNSLSTTYAWNESIRGSSNKWMILTNKKSTLLYSQLFMNRRIFKNINFTSNLFMVTTPWRSFWVKLCTFRVTYSCN